MAAGWGLLTLHYFFAEPLARWSYDLPFMWRGPLTTTPVQLVYLDDYSAKKLNQPLGDSWNRELHTRLIDRLTTDGAQLVFFDVVFDAAAENAAGDEALAEAIRRNGRVILGAGLEVLNPLGGVSQERILPPIRLLRKAAAGWGLLTFRPVDPDYGVRQMFLGTSDLPTSTWRAAELMEALAVKVDRTNGPQRWINYYGPTGQVPSVSFVQAIEPEGLPPGYFKDKIVFVGGRTAVGFLGANRDEFATPFSRSDGKMTPGVEIHATILLNLINGNWLTRLPAKQETLLVLAVGLLLGLLAWVRPLFATAAAILATLALVATVWWMVWHERVWFSWLVPVAIQIPAGLFWSLGVQYYSEARRRKELRRAFGFYLSPQMAEKISNSDFDLTPGGRTVEATIMFTDLEGFTTLAEDLDPAEVSQTLIAYFERTTACILERKGTIVKYVGDAVMAGWGAPVDQPNHAILAAEAACDLRCLSDMEMRGKRMRTRIGVSTGNVLAGNLGSSFRFDYTMIGDTTNFASRLEALNKYLGTQVLIAESTRAQLDDRIVVRPLGEFRAAGKTKSVAIHELICRCGDDQAEREWIECFAEGLREFRAGDFEKARAFMEQTRQIRGGVDGPSEFYLKTMAEVEADRSAGRLDRCGADEGEVARSLVQRDDDFSTGAPGFRIADCLRDFGQFVTAIDHGRQLSALHEVVQDEEIFSGWLRHHESHLLVHEQGKEGRSEDAIER